MKNYVACCFNPAWILLNPFSSTTVPRNVHASRPHVIGAGLPRTGTSSLKKALEEILDVGPIFHMSNNIQQAQRTGPLWEEFKRIAPIPQIHTGYPVWPPRLEDRSNPVEKERRIEILREVLGSSPVRSSNNTSGSSSSEVEEKKHEKQKQKNDSYFHGSVDAPMCLHFLDLLELHKNSTEPRKVILTSRETGKKWATSVFQTVLGWKLHRASWSTNVVLYTLMKRQRQMMHDAFYRFLPDRIADSAEDYQYFATMHDTWNDHVRATMRQYAKDNGLELSDIFLDYKVTQGWEPLCDFLEIPKEECPKEQSFPHVNDAAAFAVRLRQISMLGYGISAMTLIVAIVFFVFARYLKKVIAKVHATPGKPSLFELGKVKKEL